MEKVYTRFGDGAPVSLSVSELMRDLEEGTSDAADRGGRRDLRCRRRHVRPSSR